MSRTSSSLSNLPPPGAWRPAVAAAQRMLAPVERFLAVEASSGIVLLVVSGLALVLANSPWAGGFAHLWEAPLGLTVGSFQFERPLHFWVNDGLMTIFFFVVGLEIRREVHHGELSELKRAALPLVAALGGMLAPALIFLAVNAGRASQPGWGIPTATDIAFAVGVLTLLGKRVPPAVRVVLLALAVIDDVGAILVIALFYSGSFDVGGLGLVLAGVAAIIALQKFGARSPLAYVVPAVLMWAGCARAGIHPTLAGVAVGLLTPVRAWLGAERFVDTLSGQIGALKEKATAGEKELLPELDALNAARREAVSPVERLQHALHPWVAFGIMPLFALANAGVPLGAATFEGDGLTVFLGVVLGLALGKPLGILALARLACAVGISALPKGVGWLRMGLVGSVAGIGFTMSLFIAQLAFPPGPLRETAKLAILVGSGISAVSGFLFGAMTLRQPVEAGVAATAAEAEASTHV